MAHGGYFNSPTMENYFAVRRHAASPCSGAVGLGLISMQTRSAYLHQHA